MAIIFRYKSGNLNRTDICVAALHGEDTPAGRNGLIKEACAELNISSNGLNLSREDNGKPVLTGGEIPVFISISHTRELTVLALSLNRAVGLDTEQKNRKVNDRLQKRIISNSSESEIDPLQLWTIKESFLKMTGSGLRTAMNKIEVKRAGKYEFDICQQSEPVSARCISLFYRGYLVSLCMENNLARIIHQEILL